MDVAALKCDVIGEFYTFHYVHYSYYYYYYYYY
jgi:hypothetical protein